MPIDHFTKQQFEDALPTHKTTGEPLAEYVGFDLGEHTYLIQPFPSIPYGILIRSSVGESGVNKGCGEDSIRARIVHIGRPNGKPVVYDFHGGKSQRWVTRVSGWQDRLTDMLRRLANQVNWCRPCPKCGAVLVPHTSKQKDSKIKGQGFVRCESESCRLPGNKSATFFLTDDEGKNPVPPTVLTARQNPTQTTGEGTPLKRYKNICPKCGKAALGLSKYGELGTMFCYPSSDGCKFTTTIRELNPPALSDNLQRYLDENSKQTEGEEEERAERQAYRQETNDERYEQLRELVQGFLLHLDESDPKATVKQVYDHGQPVVSELKNFLLKN